MFSNGADSIIRFGVVALLGLLVLLTTALFFGTRSNWFTGQEFFVENWPPFSHQHHVQELGLDCRFCHQDVETKASAGYPPSETCMTCHSQVWTQAAMLETLRESLETAQPIEWKRVYTLPDYVFFNHSIHIAKGVGCTSCHGNIGEMPLTAKAADLAMGWCLDCHRDPEKNLRPKDEVFNAFYVWPSDQEKIGHALLNQNHVDTVGLTDCSTCHR